MREALDRVQSELGREAVILATRQVASKRLLPWGQREEVEITAGVGIATKPLPNVENRRVATTRSEELIDVLQRTGAVAAPPIEPRVRPPFRTHVAETQINGDETSTLAKRLDSIERILADLGRRHQRSSDVAIEVRSVYERLLASEVDEPIARELVETLRDQLTPAQLTDPAAVRLKLLRLVEAEVQCSGPIICDRKQRKVVALAGPTGVGKTTTLAKLAAGFRLREGLRTGLVTVDTYRIAAVDQLRTYAQIIELPMKVVGSPDEMQSALDEFAGLDLVLIDTAGRSPRDADQIADLNALLAAARPDATHLVVSLAAGRKQLAQTIERFRVISPAAVIVTKLDEADGAGAILGLCRDGGLPISYVTLGQDVPDEIEPARPDRIAKRIVQEPRTESRVSGEERVKP
jgi:flagellar biosynthesis protein FlhF